MRNDLDKQVLQRLPCLVRGWLAPFIAVTVLIQPASNQAIAKEAFSAGLGLRYWQTTDEIDVEDRNAEEQGISFLLQGQVYLARFFKVQFDLEFASKGFGGFKSDDPVFLGHAYALVGSNVYAGIGGGVAGLWACGTEPERDTEEPFWGIRAGYEFDLSETITLDLNGTYLINAFEELGEAETDAFLLGVVARFHPR